MVREEVTVADQIAALEDSDIETVVAAAAWSRAHGGDLAAQWRDCPRGDFCMVLALVAGVDGDLLLAAALESARELATEAKLPELVALTERLAGDGIDDERTDLEIDRNRAEQPERGALSAVLMIAAGFANGYLHRPMWAAGYVADGFGGLGYSTAQAHALVADVVRRVCAPDFATASR